MSSSWSVRLALATCALLLAAAALIWMESEGEEHRSASMLDTVPADGATRAFMQARELERAAEAHREREDGSVVVREERAIAELPANAVRIRVIDAEGRGVADIPVGLIDLVAVPLPFFEMVRSWSSNRGEFDDQPPTEDEAWFVRNGLARKEADAVFDMQVEVTSSSVIELPVDEADEVLSAQLVPTHNLPGDLQSIDAKSVFFADAFLWRGVTDAEGESIATWDRERFPLVEASFAFPWRANGLQLLRAEDSHGSREVTLVLPEIRRTRVVGVHDLAVCAKATWHAHLIARGAGKDGAPIWISWDPFLPLSEAQDQAREWIWERGLEVEIEAYLDAPFAPVVTNDPLVDASGSDAVTILRSSDYYAGARGELRQVDGATAAHAKVLWQQTEWRENGDSDSRYASTSLDADGRYQLVQAASPASLRARELLVRLEAEPTEGMVRALRLELNQRQNEGILVRRPEYQELETYFDTSILDAPGSVRDLGIQSFGDGPQLFAGVVRWTSGEAIENAMVLLPRELSSVSSGEREAIRTNEQGLFRRLGIPRSRQCELEVITGSFGPRSRFTVELGRTDLVLEVPRRGGLAGKILFERPTAIEVRAQDRGDQVQVGKVNSAGDFVVQGIAVGPVKLSFQAHGVVLHEIEGIDLSGAGVERPSALAAVDLSALAYLVTVVLHDEGGEPLRQATTTVRDPDGAFRFAAPTNRLAELRLAVPYSVRRLVIATPRYRDLEFHPSAGRMELRLSAER